MLFRLREGCGVAFILRGFGNNVVFGVGCSYSWRYLVVECFGYRLSEVIGYFREFFLFVFRLFLCFSYRRRFYIWWF